LVLAADLSGRKQVKICAIMARRTGAHAIDDRTYDEVRVIDFVMSVD